MAHVYYYYYYYYYYLEILSYAFKVNIIPSAFESILSVFVGVRVFANALIYFLPSQS